MEPSPKYRDRDTEAFASGERVKKFQSVNRSAIVRLKRLEAATQLQDLKSPPGNRLEALKGDRSGQHSIRINDQWRICFEWSSEANKAFNIEIADYH
jgi:proteic killer suppression protein